MAVSFTKDGVWLEDAENREKMAKRRTKVASGINRHIVKRLKGL
jgi:hypothetical protein